MKAIPLPVGEVLDEATELTRRVFAPWVGVLWIASVPVRLLQVHFAGRLLALGAGAGQYGTYLYGIALAATLAFVLSLLGRAVFARACALGLRARTPGVREVLRLPAAGLCGYVYAALLFEALFFATALAFVTMPAFVLLAGLAAATSTFEGRAGLVAPVREALRHGTQARVLVGLMALFATALTLCLLNLHFVVQASLWLLGAFPGLDLAPWQARLSPANPELWLVLGAAAALLVEPYWLAALVVYVHKIRSRESGEDLRLWFDRVRSAEAH